MQRPPACKNKKNARVDKDGNISIVEETTYGACPQCGGTLVEKSGRFGRFIACSNYPDCKYTRPFTMGLKCPEEGCTGELVERISKKKKKFCGCSRYPDCVLRHRASSRRRANAPRAARPSCFPSGAG